MNRKELQEKFVKLIGGLETDKSYLLDTFISKLFESLKPGQKIRINGLGFFHKIKFKLSSENDSINDQNNEFSNIIVFTKSEQFDEYISEDQIFWNPTKFDLKYNSFENLFSISAGKEFLNNELIKSGRMILPVSQNEYLDLIDSKLDSLLSNSNISENDRIEIPCLNFHIQNEEKDFSFEIVQKEIEKSELNVGVELSDTKNISEVQQIDFSELLSNEISVPTFTEEEIFDSKTEDLIEDKKEFTEVLEDLNLIDNVLEQKDEESIFNDLLNLKDVDEQNEVISDTDELVDFAKKDFDSPVEKFTPKIDNEEEEIIPNEEISWDKIISEISSDEDEISFESIIKSDDEIQQIPETIVEENAAEEIFPEIKIQEETISEETALDDIEEIKEDTTNEVLDNVINQIETEEEILPESFIDELSENAKDEQIQENILPDESFEREDTDYDDVVEEEDYVTTDEQEIFTEEELEAAEEELVSQDTQKDLSQESETDYEAPQKSNKIWILAILLIIALSTAAVYYLFPEYFNLFTQTEVVSDLSISDKKVSRIERNFDLPVTYPYPPIEENISNKQKQLDIKVETNLIENSSESKEIKTENNINKVEPVELKKTNEPISNSEKISETISKTSDTYIVQVASFKSESIAQREVNKIKSKGYSAFVERTEIPNRGIWYRVKVSGFNSVNEAQNFQIKYSKGDI